MVESGAIEGLLELLMCHKCEETAARLLEVLLNNVKIREAKATKAAIAPLSQYLLDPQTQDQQARVAYVRQEDLFFSQLLVRETLSLAAELQLQNIESAKERDDYVNNLMSRLGLVESYLKIIGEPKLPSLFLHDRSTGRSRGFGYVTFSLADDAKVYMTYAQALYGGGGWPLSVFLSPNLKPLMGGTYFPPDDKYR